MANGSALRYFILWHCAIKGTTVRATIRHGNVDVFRELLPPPVLTERNGTKMGERFLAVHDSMTVSFRLGLEGRS
jgi:hypothetical protein